ncbi:hypothetical protein EPA93_23485 [Ktedonosporobacter rubrisoli]|uniref:Domain X domain-containing protein n=1 Tax=Ktedonosporobacter rubrisoli TaxID=2509675 RepID=A0A4P6JV14_KTERU|nr:reverse transcriptase/maturase family protein [Ktedonosporobacter rubrisoli]QBD78786.1 hypothetical protein EPA93_23485 [Ktedonosporobacter rubrisoli]
MAKGHLSNERESFPLTTGSRVGTDESCIGMVREMRTAETIRGLIQERGKKGLPLERVYRLLFNPELYITAYNNICLHKGTIRPETTEKPVADVSLEQVEAIIEILRNERYRWRPALLASMGGKSLTCTEGKNAVGQRMPDLPVWADVVVMEVMGMILQAYYTPQPGAYSHGFQPAHERQKALQELLSTWSAPVWFVEGDISPSLANLDQQVLLALLSEKIKDGRFLRLIKLWLDAGYLADERLMAVLGGSPQLGTLLISLYLTKLDAFVKCELAVVEGKQAATVRTKQDAERAAALSSQPNVAIRSVSRLAGGKASSPAFHTSKYVRCGGEFLLGLQGTRQEAEEIKARVSLFLKEVLRCELSQVKLCVTHARKQSARFSGYAVQVGGGRAGQTGRNEKVDHALSLCIPAEALKARCQRYMKNGKAVHRGALVHKSDAAIVRLYQMEYSSFVAYYQLAHNRYSLKKLKWIMQQSLVKTLAYKHRMPVAAIYAKYGATFRSGSRVFAGLQVVEIRGNDELSVAHWGAQPL